MIATAENAVVASLLACVTCAECDERMARHGVEPRGEWNCPKWHAAEPEEEVYRMVRDVVEAANAERRGYGLTQLGVSLVYEWLQDPTFGLHPMPRDGNLFSQAVQVDDLCGGLAASNAAMKRYIASATRDSFRQDYEAFLRLHLAGQSGAWPGVVLEVIGKSGMVPRGSRAQLPAGFWPWKALERAAGIGARLGAHLEMSSAWQSVDLPNLVEGVTVEQVDHLAGGLLALEGQERGDLF